MRIVIKGVKTIAEYKTLKARMEELAKNYYEIHRDACDNWSHGEPVKIWFEQSLCIEYEDGSRWHYDKGDWRLDIHSENSIVEDCRIELDKYHGKQKDSKAPEIKGPKL